MITSPALRLPARRPATTLRTRLPLLACSVVLHAALLMLVWRGTPAADVPPQTVMEMEFEVPAAASMPDAVPSTPEPPSPIVTEAPPPPAQPDPVSVAAPEPAPALQPPPEAVPEAVSAAPPAPAPPPSPRAELSPSIAVPPASVVAAKPKPAPKPPRHAATIARAAPSMPAAAAVPEAAPAAAPVASLAPAPALPPTDLASPAWQGGVGAWLRSHKTYPEDARRNGEQGRVLVRFTVQRDGHVVAVSLVHSSGSAALDEAAQALLRDAHLPPFPEGMAQAQQNVTLGIGYTLTP